MNKNYLLLSAVLSVLLMTSCSSSDTEEGTITKGSPAVVNLQLNGKSITRSTPSDNEKYIKEGQAAAFDASGAIVGTVQSFLTSTSATPTISTTTQATQVSVVANPGSTSTFTSIVNKTNLEAVTTDLASTASSVKTANSQDEKTLPKYGNATLTFGTDSKASPIVDMYNLVGRIKLNSIKTNFTGTGYVDATFTPKEVFLYNANTVSTFGGTGSSPQTGENTDKAGTYAVASPTDYYYLSSGPISSYNETSPTVYTFYTFPNTSAATPTKLVIKGEFKPKDGDPEVVYYPITINKLQTNTTITKNGTDRPVNDENDSKIVKSTSYEVIITISGKGMDDPGKDITPSEATITMNVKDWTDYVQDVTVK
ncbi:hypothetical protein [Prevotella sp.]|uniref:hypothetical protein n=1 Tax=Prevotella sp. TaxID=59823 RepID=UPI0026470B6C|nr:hypothetical protein [Prevotella sp.]MDN5553946.1 hypothetical protein [Prevotella sp.]